MKPWSPVVFWSAACLIVAATAFDADARDTFAHITVYELRSTNYGQRQVDYYAHVETRNWCILARENDKAWDYYDISTGQRIIVNKKFATIKTGLGGRQSLGHFIYGTGKPVTLRTMPLRAYLSGYQKTIESVSGFRSPPTVYDPVQVQSELDRIERLGVLPEAGIKKLRGEIDTILKISESEYGTYKKELEAWIAGAEWREANEYERFAMEVRKAIPQSLLNGKVASVDGTKVHVNLGTAQGVRREQRFHVYREGAEITDPDTGQVLGKSRTKQGELVVQLAQERLSQATFSPTKEGLGVEVGDIVVIDAPQEFAVAILPPAEVAALDAEGRVPKDQRPSVHTTGVETLLAIAAADRSGVTERGKYVSEQLTTALVAKEVAIVERAVLTRVLAEIRLQNDGLDNKERPKFFDADLAKKFGEQIGATYAVVGSIKAIPYQHPHQENLELNLRLVEIQNGQVILARQFNVLKPK